MATLPPSEHAEQACVVDWARRRTGACPALGLLFAIPNGAALTWKADARGQRYSPQAARLKAEGLRPGVPDLCLPVARGGYHALYLEMKAGKNKPSKEQAAFLEALAAEGNLARVCYSAEEAIGVIEAYLEID
jgi:hypothetical protein